MGNTRKLISVGAAAALLMGGLVTTPAHAAATGAFGDFVFNKTQDGYQFTNNPVDDSANNGIVAVNDFVGFTFQGNTSAQPVGDATITLTKPDCWAWEGTVDSSLNFAINDGTGVLSKPDANTLSVTWNQNANGVVLTQPFRARATQACADGSTWTPTATVTDGSGSRQIALDTLTVRSTPRADISISAVGSPRQVNRWFSNIGPATPAYQQTWRVRLAPETLAAVGYADPNGKVTFSVEFTSNTPGVTSAFEFPNSASAVIGCWRYDPVTLNQFSSQGNQIVNFSMSTRPECVALLGSSNTLLIDSFTPDQYIPEGETVSLTATVKPDSWTTVDGQPIPDTDPNNNSATVRIVKSAPTYGFLQGMGIFAPLVADADYAKAYPRDFRGTPVVAGVNSDTFATVTDGNVGFQGEFTGEAYYQYENPSLNNLVAYQFWDATKQQLNLDELDAAVLGAVTPRFGATTPELDSRALPAESYTKLCTTDFNGSNSATAATMTWADCASLDSAAITGMKFDRPGNYAGATFPGYAPDKRLFTQVPFKAVADAGTTTATLSRWEADEWDTNRERSASVKIVGNTLLLEKRVAESQIQPEGTATYTLAPDVAQPAGTFLPADVPNLRLVDTLDIGVESVDTSGLDPFWKVEVVAADLGADGIPYTADDVSPMQLIFTPTGDVDTATELPTITYTATVGVLLPPRAAPYDATLKNTATLTADQSAGPATDNASLAAGTPEAVFYRKQLVSPPVIEVEDKPTAWRVEWINYNNVSLGQARFVDVFPHNGDETANGQRRSNFDGTSKLAEITLTGSAAVPGATVELTTDAPDTVGVAPADSTTWVAVDPDDPSSWPAGATAIRITLPEVPSSTQGYGSMTMRFNVADQREGNVYDNNASGLVEDPNNGRIFLGVRDADEVRVVASSIAGVAWVDANRDGVRQSDETLLPNVTVHLYRGADRSAPFATARTDEDGAYRFDNLHSSGGVMIGLGEFADPTEYQVVFDADDLRSRGYEITTQLAGDDTTVDSDADAATGEVAPVDLPVDTDLTDLDAGVVVNEPTAVITAAGELTSEMHWGIEKTAGAVGGGAFSEVVADPQTGEAAVEYTVTTTELAPTHTAKVTGAVTVNNPSTGARYLVTVALTSADTGVVCEVDPAHTEGTNPAGVDLPLGPGASGTYGYTCAGTPEQLETNTVTADVSVEIAATDAATLASLTPSVEYTYDQTKVDATVNVSDVFLVDGAERSTREFGPYEWTAEGTTHVETYRETVNVPMDSCVALTNRAELTGLAAGPLAAETANELCVDSPEVPTPPPVPVPSEPGAPSASSKLANTGAAGMVPAMLAAALMLMLGAAMVAAATRRPRVRTDEG